MKSLKLELDDLEVESFMTTDAESVRGTVGGYEPSMPEGTCVPTCTAAMTVPATCLGTCDDPQCKPNGIPGGTALDPAEEPDTWDWC